MDGNDTSSRFFWWRCLVYLFVELGSSFYVTCVGIPLGLLCVVPSVVVFVRTNQPRRSDEEIVGILLWSSVVKIDLLVIIDIWQVDSNSTRAPNLLMMQCTWATSLPRRRTPERCCWRCDGNCRSIYGNKRGFSSTVVLMFIIIARFSAGNELTT